MSICALTENTCWSNSAAVAWLLTLWVNCSQPVPGLSTVLAVSVGEKVPLDDVKNQPGAVVFLKVSLILVVCACASVSINPKLIKADSTALP